MSKKFCYRSDIDGLRAIAVLLVIIYHANFKLFTGGFIGVDVFFVLSGFLITYTIEKEITENRFSFKEFYLRRIRRIIPVLFFILLLCTIPAYYMFPSDFESYGRTLLHSILSTNNFYLWANNRQYFSQNSELIPLLHTWSLSIEEQFYLIWPSVLLVLYKIKSKKIKAVCVVLILIILFFLSVYLTKTNPNTAYLLLPGRVFELGSGAGLAIFWYQLPLVSKRTNNIFSIIGLLLIIIPAVVLNKTSAFPGLNALWPCLGAAFLIFSNKENNENIGIINQLLKNKFFVSIGLISYSLYLWHWPIFSFLKYFNQSLTGGVRIAAITLLFALSYTTWRYIEQPFRTTLKFNFSKTIVYILLPIFIISGIIYGVVDLKNGFPERFTTLSEFNPKKNYPNDIRKECFDQYKIGNCTECFLGIKKDHLDGVLIGDSFANQTAAFLDVLAKDANLYLHDSAAGGYSLLANVDEDNNALWDEEYARNRLAYAKKFKTIYIAANWNVLTHSTANRKRIIATISELANLNKNIVIFDCLRPLPEMKLHKLKLAKAYPKYFKESYTFIPQKREADYIVHELKKQFPSVTVIDMSEGVKINTEYTTQINNSIVYRNDDHLNTSGAQQLAEKYLLLHKNPLKNLK